MIAVEAGERVADRRNTAIERTLVTPREATATAGGGKLRVAAADRVALSDALEEEALLHRRLTVFYGYFAGLVVVTSTGSLLSPPPPGWDRRYCSRSTRPRSRSRSC